MKRARSAEDSVDVELAAVVLGFLEHAGSFATIEAIAKGQGRAFFIFLPPSLTVHCLGVHEGDRMHLDNVLESLARKNRVHRVLKARKPVAIFLPARVGDVLAQMGESKQDKPAALVMREILDHANEGISKAHLNRMELSNKVIREALHRLQAEKLIKTVQAASGQVYLPEWLDLGAHVLGEEFYNAESKTFDGKMRDLLLGLIVTVLEKRGCTHHDELVAMTLRSLQSILKKNAENSRVEEKHVLIGLRQLEGELSILRNADRNEYTLLFRGNQRKEKAWKITEKDSNLESRSESKLFVPCFDCQKSVICESGSEMSPESCHYLTQFVALDW